MIIKTSSVVQNSINIFIKNQRNEEIFVYIKQRETSKLQASTHWKADNKDISKMYLNTFNHGYFHYNLYQKFLGG